MPIPRRTVAGRCLVAAAALACSNATHAAITIYNASLSGANESPPNSSSGTGTATVTIDTSANTMRVQVSFTGLGSGSTASHIHATTAAPFAGTAGVATTVPTFPGFPLGVTSGTYDNLFDLLSASTYNPAFVAANGGTIAGAESALLNALGLGEAYLNIHTTNVPSGEIRGFLIAVPEPSSWAIMLVGFGAIGLAIRARRRTIDPAAA